MTFPACSDRRRRIAADAHRRVLPLTARAGARAGARSRAAALLRRCRRRVGVRSVHRPRHPRRRRAAHRSRHDLLVPADQGRRARRRREGRAGRQGVVRDRLLPRRAHRGAGRHPGRHRAGAADHQLAHVRRQQGVRHRHDQEGAEGHRHRRGAHLRPLGARPRGAGAEAPVHHARQVRGERCRPRSRRRSAIASRSTSRSSKARRPSIARINIVGNKAFTETRAAPRDARCPRRTGCRGTRRTTSTRSRSSRPTSRRCAASTRTAATSSSPSTRRRCRSRPTRKRSSSRSTSPRAPRTRCPASASRASWRSRSRRSAG